MVDFFRIKWNMAIHPYLPAMKDKRGNYFPLDLLVPLEGQFAKNSFLDSFPVVVSLCPSFGIEFVFSGPDDKEYGRLYT